MDMRIITLLIIATFVLSHLANAQFKKFYARKDNYAISTRIVPLTGGDKLVLNNFQNGPGGDTLQLIRTNSQGNIVWSKHLNFRSSTVTGWATGANGDIFLVGGSSGQFPLIATQPKAFFLKVTQEGDVDTIKGYGTSSVSEHGSIVVQGNSCLIASQYADFNNFAARFSYFFILLKTDLNGNREWVKRISIPFASTSGITPKIQGLADGGAIISFSINRLATTGGTPPVRTIYVMRVNSEGERVWVKSVDVSTLGIHSLVSMEKINATDYALLVRIEPNFLSQLINFGIYTFNESGEFLAGRKYGLGVNSDVPFSLKLLPDNNLAVAGRRVDRTVSPFETGEFIMKINPSLTPVAARWYKFGSYNLLGADLAVDNDGTCHYATSYFCQSQGKYFQAVVKAAPTDLQAGCQSLESNLTLPDSAVSLSFADESYTMTNWFGLNAKVAVETIPVSVATLDICEGCPDEISSTDPKMAAISFRIFPNPAQNWITIKTEVPWQLDAFDFLGRQVLSTQLNPGQNQLDVSALSKGLYHFSGLNANGKIVRRLHIE
jgi:hypothetical protein